MFMGGKDKKILLVDDAKTIRLMLRKYLERFGFNNIIEAENGAEGITMFHSERPDIIFLDINMPDVDGLETLKNILEEDPFARIILVTAESMEDERVKDSIGLGAFRYIQKPISAAKISLVLKELDRDDANLTSIA